MRILRNYFAKEIYHAVFFVLIALLALFAFFDMLGEVRIVGIGPYKIEHAFLYVTLGMPTFAYELMPIAALIGTIYVLSQFAARSEFSVMRASTLSMFDSIKILIRIGLVLVIITFVLGEFIAPKATALAKDFKRQIFGATVSSEFKSGLWAKDKIYSTNGKKIIGSRFLNARKIENNGTLRDLKIYEFDLEMQMIALITAGEANFTGAGQWLLNNVKKMQFSKNISKLNEYKNSAFDSRHLATIVMNSEITPEIMAVMVGDPNRMSAYDLAVFSKHLQDTKQRSDRYEIALWKKIIYPFVVIVMMIIALPFAYLNTRSGGISLKIFIGIMIGIAFHLSNNLFSHLGMLNFWPPIITVISPSLTFIFVVIFALWWVNKY